MRFVAWFFFCFVLLSFFLSFTFGKMLVWNAFHLLTTPVRSFSETAEQFYTRTRERCFWQPLFGTRSTVLRFSKSFCLFSETEEGMGIIFLYHTSPIIIFRYLCSCKHQLRQPPPNGPPPPHLTNLPRSRLPCCVQYVRKVKIKTRSLRAFVFLNLETSFFCSDDFRDWMYKSPSSVAAGLVTARGLRVCSSVDVNTHLSCRTSKRPQSATS